MAFKKVAESILDKIENGAIPLNQGIGIKTGDQDKSNILKGQENKKNKKKK
jgi:hypothetical protein